MAVTFLPIVRRELGVAARKPSTYRMRMWFALGTSVLAAVMLLIGSQAPGRSMGADIFRGLATLAFVYCLLTGLRYTADALSEEKREGTLGLLFLTDLRGYDVVLGKLMSAAARTLQGLLAFLPVLAIGLLIGGMTGAEFWRVAAVLMNALFFSLCVGLWVSALSREAHRALATTAGMLLFLTVAPFALNGLVARFWPNHFVFVSSPASAGILAFDLAYRGHQSEFWRALIFNHLAAWAFLVVACVVLPRSWQDRPASLVHNTRTRRRSAARPHRSAQKAAALRQRLLDINPVCWLAARHERQRVLLWVFVGTVALGGTAALGLSYLLAGHSFGAFPVLSFILGMTLKLWVAWHACATLAEARRTGAVELLLATPLKVEDIIRGHWQALQRIFLWPVVAALVLSALPAIEVLMRQPPASANLFLLPVPGMTLFGMATFILDLLALAWVGMWMGLSQPRAVQAFAKTILFAMIIPMVVFCLPHILFDLFWISWARRKLEHQFRRAAADRYTPAPGFAGWLPETPSGTNQPPIIAKA